MLPITRILILAGILRLGYVWLCPQLPLANDALAYDQEGYHLAFSSGVLTSEKGPVAISKGPVYPLFLAGVYRLFGHHYAAVRVVQAILSTLAVAFIYGIAILVFDHRTAIIAALIAALYPPFISYSGLLLTELLSVFLLCALIFSLIKALDAKTLIWWVASGLLGGILILHREETLLVVLGSVMILLWFRTQAKGIGLFIASAALILLPWVARNYAVYRTFVLVAPQQGYQIWLSTYPAGWDAWHDEDPYYQRFVKVGITGNDVVKQDQRVRQEAIRQLWQHPLTYLRLCLQRIPRMWVGGHSNTFAGLEQHLSHYVTQGAYGKAILKTALFTWNMLLLLLGILGAWLSLALTNTKRQYIALLLLPILVTSVVHFFLFAALRYQVPIMPFVILLGAFSLCYVWNLTREFVPARASTIR